MKNGAVQVICGPGKGKTDMAVGCAVRALSDRKNVIMIQFLKGSLKPAKIDHLKRLEPELKVFCFEKSSDFFEHLSEEEKAEERRNICNGLNFAKKVMTTGECDLLILDEILGIIDCGIMKAEDLIQYLECRENELSVILTGKILPKELEGYVDVISVIENLGIDKTEEE